MIAVRCRYCDIGFPAPEVAGHERRCPMRGGQKMGFQKTGTGEILPEPDDNQKVAKANWTEHDAKELAKENAAADAEEEE